MDIFVFLWPETLKERINFYLFGRPVIFRCNEFRVGSEIVECIDTTKDSCVAFPIWRVSQIVWPNGFREYLSGAINELKISQDDDDDGEDSVMRFPPESSNVFMYR